MGAETSKSIPRRLRDPAFHQKFFVGLGLDIGAGGDPLDRYVALFPQLTEVITFDVPGSDADLTGDGTTLAGISDGMYDFVHSSHCLEHLADPVLALHNWLRVTKPGGHVIVVVPDEELYEAGVWPSVYNTDHKHSFRMGAVQLTPRMVDSICVPQFLWQIMESLDVMLVRLERLESTYLPGVLGDQTIGIGECAIEFVLRRET